MRAKRTDRTRFHILTAILYLNQVSRVHKYTIPCNRACADYTGVDQHRPCRGKCVRAQYLLPTCNARCALTCQWRREPRLTSLRGRSGIVTASRLLISDWYSSAWGREVNRTVITPFAKPIISNKISDSFWYLKMRCRWKGNAKCMCRQVNGSGLEGIIREILNGSLAAAEPRSAAID